MTTISPTSVRNACTHQCLAAIDEGVSHLGSPFTYYSLSQRAALRFVPFGFKSVGSVAGQYTEMRSRNNAENDRPLDGATASPEEDSLGRASIDSNGETVRNSFDVTARTEPKKRRPAQWIRPSISENPTKSVLLLSFPNTNTEPPLRNAFVLNREATCGLPPRTVTARHPATQSHTCHPIDPQDD